MTGQSMGTDERAEIEIFLDWNLLLARSGGCHDIPTKGLIEAMKMPNSYLMASTGDFLQSWASCEIIRALKWIWDKAVA